MRSFSLSNAVNQFYILAFLPLVLIVYLDALGIVIPMFGFLLFLLKKDELPFHKKTNLAQKGIGLTIIFSSFFVYYLLMPLVSFPMVFFSVANYILYLFGLCLIFLDVRSFRKLFAPFFAMILASSTIFISDWLEIYLSSYVVPFFANLVGGFLRTLGIATTVHESQSTQSIITMSTPKGPLLLALVWSCVGVRSVLVFSVILVILLLEDSSGIKTKLLWSVIGVFGTIIVNIFRVMLIFLTDYYYGSDVGGNVHYVAGYILFLLWLVSFLYIFSRKDVVAEKFRSVKIKLSHFSQRLGAFRALRLVAFRVCCL